MGIKLKTKVALGGIFLFALLVLVGLVSIIYFNRITGESKEIVMNNYETLNYSRDMLRELDQFNGVRKDSAQMEFEANLELQEKNITEPGERELTDSLRRHFDLLKKAGNSSLPFLVRKDISGIMELNLNAINKKNRAASDSADRAKTLITLILAMCTLLGLTFIFNFPSLVAAPVAQLTEGIKAIANRNYGERIHSNRKDEFGQLADAFNSMAERLDEYEHSNLSRILFEKKRAETVINSLKDASVGLDGKGMILFANAQALQLLNLQEQEIVGQGQDDVKKKNDLFRFLCNEQSNIPFKIIVDGKENYFTKETIDLGKEDGNAGSVLVLKNITSFKELDVAKTNFIATISHELKTPLASSDFSLKLLENSQIGSLNAEQQELINQIKNDNQRMLNILSELLNLSQVEAGKIQLKIETVDPVAIVRNSVSAVIAAARDKQIILEEELAPGLEHIQTDADKIGWVLNNFLTNAIKYSNEKTMIKIVVQRKEDKISFYVADQGPGIDEAYTTRIFDRYFQIPGRSDKKGSGIGLAICKEFIEALQGNIWVKSKLGEGSQFGFDLPAPKSV